MFSTRHVWLLLLCLSVVLAACSGGRRGGRIPFDAGGVRTDASAADGSPDGETNPTCDLDCSHLDGECLVGRCNEAGTECVAVPLADGDLCEDGDVCTSGETCSGGSCGGGGATDCSALTDDCNVGTCDPSLGCVATPVSDGASCDDGDPCTTGEWCSSGACSGGEALDCSHVDTDCSAGECNPSTGTCRARPVADGTLCDDGNGCTTLDRCMSGVCSAGTARDCSAFGDDCNTGACDPTTGSCYAAPVVDGTFCDDGDSCTVSDACSSGVCTGTNTCCGIHDFRLSEVYGSSPDYIEITNTGTCTLSTSGLVLRWYLGCDTAAQTYTLPSRSIAPGSVFRIVDSSTTMSNEIYIGTNICHNEYSEGWVALCNGSCSATCTNYLDYMEMAGSGTSPTARPTCASFSPSPLYMGSATSTQSATRLTFTNTGAAARQSDWTVGTYSRSP